MLGIRRMHLYIIHPKDFSKNQLNLLVKCIVKALSYDVGGPSFTAMQVALMHFCLYTSKHYTGIWTENHKQTALPDRNLALSR